jgi:hypothetical protein
MDTYNQTRIEKTRPLNTKFIFVYGRIEREKKTFGDKRRGCKARAKAEQ